MHGFWFQQAVQPGEGESEAAAEESVQAQQCRQTRGGQIRGGPQCHQNIQGRLCDCFFVCFVVTVDRY